MAWYVAKIVGKDPKWGFKRQFRKDIDPEDPEFPEDGLYEVQTRTRTYYVVENGNAREVTLKEAKEIVETMKSEVQKDEMPADIGNAVRKNARRNVELLEVALKDKLNLESIMSVKDWESLAGVIKEWAEEYGSSADEQMVCRVVEIYADTAILMRDVLRAIASEDQHEIASAWGAFLRFGVLREYLKTAMLLSDENAKKRMIDELEKILEKVKNRPSKVGGSD